MAKTIRKRGCSSFYLRKNTFDSIPILMLNDLESVAVFSEHWSKIIRTVHEKYHVVEVIATV